ncbi:MAG TPA: biotin/lipoyl-containing protein, partial [Parvularculaceae bacterium]|nr:biotin/lipoyl-containing protein [Parvularculaceae bacterium]
MTVEIRVPTLGESVTEATIARWLKREGETVNADEPLVELETDKVSVEVPAPSAGVLSEIAAKEGDTVEVNALLGMIGGAAKSAKSAAKPEPKAVKTPAPKPASSGGKDIEVRVPAGGESVSEADVSEWFKKEGDAVGADEPLVMLETDKAAMDVVAPAAGVVKKIAAKKGETVKVGALLAVIAAGESPSAGPNGAEKATASKQEARGPSEKTLSPAPRRIVEERGLDPAQIVGTGKDGRITKGDALKAAAPAPVKARTLEA